MNRGSLTPDELNYLRELLLRRTANVLDAGKEYLLETRLEALTRELGIPSVSELIRLARMERADYSRRIVEAITSHETLFFRDARPFDALRQRILPPLVAARERSKTLTIWSAACSSGQEPYSIAMLLLESFPELALWPVRVIATDISEQVLARARAGRYQQLEMNRGLPARMLVKYFERDGLEWSIKPSVRDLVVFEKRNLLDGWPGALRPDIIFLRNVLLYFSVETKREILLRMRRLLAPDGALILGVAETTLNIDDQWERHSQGGATWYSDRR